jgi:cellulose synthase/poly-beta-1,6-N-acetylglucosamine synthase-like glycosyltransferase
MQILDIVYLGIYFIIIYLSLIWLIIFIENRKSIFKNPAVKNFPNITFLVPAHNEEKNIENCIKSLLNLNYPKEKVKIIVINDGSTDRTEEIVSKFKKFGVKILNKEHKKGEGKATALNYGMRHVDTELVACMDADSIAERNYLIKTVGYLEDSEVAAVTPAVKITSVKSIVSKIQWTEYLVSLVFRKLFAIFNCQFTIPGAGGIYKTEILRKIGCFDPKSLTEDMEIAMRMQSLGYKIENCLDAYVYTGYPNNFKTLFKQRMRWYRGYIENFKKYFFMMFKEKYGNFGAFFMPITIIWIFIIVLMFVLQINDIVFNSIDMLLKLSLTNYSFIMTIPTISLFSFESLKLAFSIQLIFGFVLTWIGIKTSGVEKVKRRKFYYALYILSYPFLFAFFWTSAIILDVLRVEKRW